jgi:hypothetical protein
MSFSFHSIKCFLLLLLCAAGGATLTGCRSLGHGAPKPDAPPAGKESLRRFAGTWYDGAHSQVIVSEAGDVTAALARPATGVVFGRPEAAGDLSRGIPSAGATPVRLRPASPACGAVVVQVVSQSGEAELLTLTFRVDSGGDRLRVLARSDRREETYNLVRDGRVE